MPHFGLTLRVQARQWGTGKNRAISRRQGDANPCLLSIVREFVYLHNKVSPANQENVYYIKGGIKPFSE
jgi:hypothetical protein